MTNGEHIPDPVAQLEILRLRRQVEELTAQVQLLRKIIIYLSTKN